MGIYCTERIILLAVLLCTKAYSMACNSSWAPFGNSCYKVFEDTTTRGKAEQLCVEQGSHLVSFQSQEEFNRVISMLKRFTLSNDFWIGLKKKHVAKSSDLSAIRTNWLWEDGGPVVWHNWYSNIDTNRSEPQLNDTKVLVSRSANNSWFGKEDDDIQYLHRVCEIDYSPTKTSDPESPDSLYPNGTQETVTSSKEESQPKQESQPDSKSNKSNTSAIPIGVTLAVFLVFCVALVVCVSHYSRKRRRNLETPKNQGTEDATEQNPYHSIEEANMDPSGMTPQEVLQERNVYAEPMPYVPTGNNLTLDGHHYTEPNPYFPAGYEIPISVHSSS